MKRFFNNGKGNNDGFNYGGDDDDDDDLDDDGGEDGDEEFTHADYLHSIQMDLTELDINQKLLQEAILIAKADILWWFRTPEEKTHAIDTVYRKLSDIIDGGLIDLEKNLPDELDEEKDD